jgi:lactoylglutathione lyase
MMRILHTSITTLDMDRAIRFYTEIMGLSFVRRRAIPENDAEITFVRDDESGAEIELTWWRGKKELAEGDQLDHIAFAVPDMDAAMKRFRQAGVTVAKEPYSLSGGSSRIAFITDPDGIWLEIIERPSHA